MTQTTTPPRARAATTAGSTSATAKTSARTSAKSAARTAADAREAAAKTAAASAVSTSERLRRVRLRRSNLRQPGMTRRRAGRHFSYRNPDGTPVDEQTRERIRGLAIPPAWQDVWICPYPNGHIQAVGTDAAGRRQYLYHPQWRLQRDELKHTRVLTLASVLPDVRAAVEADLMREEVSRERVLAAGLRLLDKGIFRSGGEAYADEHGTHGIATLLRRHVKLKEGRIVLDFPAKGGIRRTVSLVDQPLEEAVRALRAARTGKKRLFVYPGQTGWVKIHSDHLNERFKELAGPDYTVKDLRTWQATVIAAVEFALAPPATTQTARRRTERAVMTVVSEQLGNTPSVARASYVDPRVVERYQHGSTIAPTLQELGVTALDQLVEPVTRHAVEASVSELLRR